MNEKFTSTGEVRVEVTLEPGADDPRVVPLHVVVSDTGIGIPLDKQQLIFDAFTQADGATTRRYGGTGLGLSIAVRLVALMDGRMWVESEPGSGSRFHFTLKLTPADDDGECQESAMEPREGPVLSQRVLLVEDNPVSRVLAKRLLEKQGHHVVVVPDGREALSAVRADALDPVLMDLQMPDMNGLEATSALRASEAKDGRGRRLRIVAMTAHATAGDREHCLAAGMDDCVLKPISASALRSAMERAACQ